MHTETSAPFTPRGPSWAAVFKLLGWLSPLLVGAAWLWLGQQFATHSEVSAAVAPLAPLPAQVQSLQEFRTRQERAQDASAAKFEAIQQDLAGLKVQQSVNDKKLDRVLDSLERLNRRPQ